MFGINPMELMIILMVALIVVGPKRLPEIGRTIGRAFSELRRVQEEVRDTIRFDLEDDEPEPPTRPVRRRSPDAPRTPSAAELASAAERRRLGDPASEPEDTSGAVSEVASEAAVPETVPEVAPEVAPEVVAPPAGVPGAADPPAPAGGDGPVAPLERPGDADSPNGSPRRPSRDEAG
jgi:sec-independent protein translocase protein TatB